MKRFLPLLLLTLVWLAVPRVQAQSRVHTVQANETLYRISLKYQVTVAELYRLNPSAKEGIRVGEQLRIPDTPTRPRPTPTKAAYHAVEQGETLFSIARKYGLKADELRKANPSIMQDRLPVGWVLVIPPVVASSPVPQGGSTSPSSGVLPQAKPVGGLKAYTIPTGETLYNLSRATGWTQEQLLQYNPQLKEGVRTGMVILIPDASIANNRTLQREPQRTILNSNNPSLVGQAIQRVVLALPFKEDASKRFVDYYEGFLLAIKELKDAGGAVELHVVDCSDADVLPSVQEIRAMRHVDLIMGGVSDYSIEALAKVADEVGASYVIPFSSKDYHFHRQGRGAMPFFQINTPHESLYKVVAQKFMEQYKGYTICIADATPDGGDKSTFVATLQDMLKRAGTAPKHFTLTDQPQPEQIAEMAGGAKRCVIVPTSASFAVASTLMSAVAVAQDSLGVKGVSLFGYPEWQTYTSRLDEWMHSTQSTFYTTFYTSTTEPFYQAFQREYITWFSHSVGNTYPRYSILGYDTAKYFLMRSKRAWVGAGAAHQYRGVQSFFFFVPDLINPALYLNQGVIFVQYHEGERITKN